MTPSVDSPPPPRSHARGVAGQMTPRRGVSTRTKVVAIVAAVALLIGVVVVVAEFGLRSFAEGRVRSAIVDNLPPDVTGDVSVKIGGGSFLAQYAAGTFDEVTVTTQNFEVKGVPVAATVVAHDVPTDQSKPVPRASVTMTLSQAAVNAFVTIPGSDEIVLGDGTIGYSGSFQILGLTFGYDATAVATPNGPDVQLAPSGAKLSAGSASIDVGGALKAVVADPISICVAKYLPERVQLTSISPTAGQVVVTADATDLLLTADALKTTGTCG
ncbi:LmeA family phospholipid-binding protein [Subtercola boreus]|uniref:DUF2993 domain-containing protein n=1 Tax=Subtercola boreus TaxID=120213 RepID=A0A3E0W9H5_9MICO|nr:DUF2993 domain-containing protein [Subtercola boreus]RFA20289.1 hypothetical protein B7R24_09785 [Subtercola boreus]RFA20441.1 hypothetical protein B7R23_09720 [Subtercola boreus]RFA26693.1 hypothetical protein B7R25_09850 [Subtercola boreus]